MKLYSAGLSPFSTRVRIQIAAKGLGDRVALVDPPGGLFSEAWAEMNITGKVPALEVENGCLIPESTVIMQYLEEKFPEPSLWPDGAEARATTRVLIQFADLYLFEPILKLIHLWQAGAQDANAIEAQFLALEKGMRWTEKFLASRDYAVAGRLSLADCALAPTLYYASWIHDMLGRDAAFSTAPDLGIYATHIRNDANVGPEIAGMETALNAYMEAAAKAG